MSKMKLRIVKKEKDGITLSPAKGAEPVKMGWKEFEANFDVEEKVWVVPNASYKAKLDEANDYINQAAVAFITSGGLKGEMNPNGLVNLTVLGECTQKIQEILGCTNIEALGLIRQRIDAVSSFGQAPKPKKKKSNKPSANKQSAQKQEQSGFAVLADNPVLMEMKKNFNKK